MRQITSMVLIKDNKTARSKQSGRAKEREFVTVIKAHYNLTANSWAEEEANQKKRKSGLIELPEEEDYDDLFDLDEIEPEASDDEAGG